MQMNSTYSSQLSNFTSSLYQHIAHEIDLIFKNVIYNNTGYYDGVYVNKFDSMDSGNRYFTQVYVVVKANSSKSPFTEKTHIQSYVEKGALIALNVSSSYVLPRAQGKCF